MTLIIYFSMGLIACFFAYRYIKAENYGKYNHRNDQLFMYAVCFFAAFYAFYVYQLDKRTQNGIYIKAGKYAPALQTAINLALIPGLIWLQVFVCSQIARLVAL